MMSVAQRYYQDATFHALVDAIEAVIHEAKYTPTEVREAAVLACIHYEETRLSHPFIIPVRDLDQR